MLVETINKLQTNTNSVLFIWHTGAFDFWSDGFNGKLRSCLYRQANQHFVRRKLKLQRCSESVVAHPVWGKPVH